MKQLFVGVIRYRFDENQWFNQGQYLLNLNKISSIEVPKKENGLVVMEKESFYIDLASYKKVLRAIKEQKSFV